mgnify:FL=1
MRKCIAGLLCGLALVVGAFPAAAEFSIPAGYVDKRLVIATEPGKTDSDYVAYYQNGTKTSLDDISWVDGREGHGKAVSLSGKDDFLAVGYDQLRLTNFSVSMWVNWKGAADGKTADQRLLSIVQDADNYIALSPLHKDDSQPDSQGRIINGLYLDVTIAGERETGYKASAPEVQTGLPQNKWHHIALVARQPYLSLYVDGVLHAQAMWSIGLRELNPQYLRIGGGMSGDASLNALVDDVELYGFDLSSDQLKMLAGGVDPLEPGATVPPTTTAAPATRPTTTSTTAINLDDPGKDQSLKVALTVGGCGLGIFVLLTLGALLLGKKPPREGDA